MVLSDEPGWHGRVLAKTLESHGIEVYIVSLSSCALDIATQPPRVAIPGFSGIPDGVFVRGIAGGSLEEIVLRLNVLHALELLGVAVFNSGRAIERTVDKGLTSFLLRHHGIATPRTWVSTSASAARALAAQEIRAGRAMVMKPVFGSQGVGVTKLETLADFDTMSPQGGVYYLQDYVATGSDRFCDWRVFVVAGRSVAAMRRYSDHWVTNRAQGASCEAANDDVEMCQMGEAAADAMQVDYAGVDLFRDSNGRWIVGEVNGIPAWQGLQRVSKVDITSRLVEAFIKKMRRTTTLAAAG